jgi:hypothetical protein
VKKLNYLALHILVKILRVVALIVLFIGIYFLIKDTCFYHFIISGSCSLLKDKYINNNLGDPYNYSSVFANFDNIQNEVNIIFNRIQGVTSLIFSLLLFALAEIIKVAIDISNNTKQTSNHLETIANSLLERDKIIMKMMGIIVDQMKNK